MTRKIIMALCLVIMALLAPSIFLSSSEPISGEVVYQLGWEWGEAQPSDNGWIVTNDLGYEIEVTGGYMVSYSAEMIECEHRHGLFETIMEWFTPAYIYAGHGDELQDASRLVAPYVESLVDLETIQMGTATLVEPNYCEAHYLLAYANHRTVNLPEDKDMSGLSLYVEGQYRTDGNEWTPFTIETNLANGTLQELTQNTEVIHVVTEDITEVTFYRKLDSLFADVDFATMDEQALGKAIIWSLIANVEAVVTRGKVH